MVTNILRIFTTGWGTLRDAEKGVPEGGGKLAEPACDQAILLSIDG
jgi:hypothetical protein